MKRALLIRAVVAVCVFLLALSVHAGQPASPERASGTSGRLFGPYVSSVGRHSARIAWVAEEPGQPAQVVAEAVGRQLNCPVRSEPVGEGVLYVAECEGLPPGKRVTYQVQQEEETFTGSFRTAPAGAARFSFVAYGDTRSRPQHHERVAAAIVGERPEFVLHTGDLVSDGRVWSQWGEQFFNPARHYLGRAPIWPARGNHEADAVLYRRLFVLPDRELYYSFDYGNAHFVVLDTYQRDADRQAMLEWFERDLAAQDADWVFVMYHTPTFNVGGHGPYSKWGREDFLPVMYEHGVDFVLTGHSHLYERFLPITREGAKPINFIVTGGGGAPNYPVAPSPILAGGVGRSVPHYCQFTIEGGRLRMVVRKPDGTVIDRLSLAKDGGTYSAEMIEKTVSYAEATELQFLFADLRVTLSGRPAAGRTVEARLTAENLGPETQLEVGPPAGDGSWGVRAQRLRAADGRKFTVTAPESGAAVTPEGFEPPLRVSLHYRSDGLSSTAENLELQPSPETLRAMFPEPEPVQVQAAPGPMEVDGDLSDWADVEPLPNPYHDSATGPFRLCWTPEGLFGAVEARDESIRAVPDAPWQADGVEMFLDKPFGRYLEINQNTAQYGISPAPESGAGPAHFTVAHGAGEEEDTGVQSAWRPANGGYSLEFFLPAALLKPAHLREGTVMGLNLVLNDDGGVVRQFYSDKGDGGWRRPITWGAVRLVR